LAEFKLKFRETVPFGAALPEDKLNASTCPKADGGEITMVTAKTAAKPPVVKALFIRERVLKLR
jgi:hypothetical protein